MFRELLGTFALSPLSSVDRSCSSVGPAIEVFGIECIVFGSAPSPVSRAQSNAGCRYEIAHEASVELGVDQEKVDAMFGGNAQQRSAVVTVVGFHATE